MAERRVTFIVGANIRNFQKGIQNASKGLKNFGRKAERTGKNLSRSLTGPILAIGFFCDMLDTHKVFHEKNEKLIKKYGSGRQKRKMQKSLNDTTKLLDQWSRDYFGVDLDHVKRLGVDIPQIEYL